jgi:hypothetical protein
MKFGQTVSIIPGGHVACMGDMRNGHNISAGKPEGKRSLRKPGHRWEDNIRMGLTEIGREGVK